MASELTQSIGKHSMILGIFAIIVAVTLGLVNSATREEIILQQQAAERKALAEVFPAELHDNDLLSEAIALYPQSDDASPFTQMELLGLRLNRNAYVARLNDRVSGIILPVSVPDGYNGEIRLLVGIQSNGTISGVRVVSHKETPGLGDKIDLRISDWVLGFDRRSLSNPTESGWQVKKDGGDFDQFVGATITPRAMVGGVKRALEFFRENQEALTER